MSEIKNCSTCAHYMREDDWPNYYRCLRSGMLIPECRRFAFNICDQNFSAWEAAGECRPKVAEKREKDRPLDFFSRFFGGPL